MKDQRYDKTYLVSATVRATAFISQAESQDNEEQRITRSELLEIFLERANALVSEDSTNHIFLQVDTEGTGLVHADDVANYINSIEPRT